MIPIISFRVWPREMGFPERKGKWRIVNNKKEFLQAINACNGKTNVYTSVYSFSIINNNRPDYNSANIDRLFFDLDSKESFENIKKLHTHLLKKNLKHYLIFSGGGFHCYVKATGDVVNKKDCIENAQRKIADEAGLSVGNAHDSAIDSAIIGDIARISRVPNTYNIRRNRYCIYITEHDLMQGMKYIKEKAKKQNDINDLKFYGENAINLKEFDFPGRGSMINNFYNFEPANIDINDKFVPSLPPCVQLMITQHTNHKTRYWGAIWLRDMGFAEEESKSIFKKYLSKYPRNDGTLNDYNHMCIHDHVFETVYHKGEHYFPKCDKLKEEGLCKERCKWYNKMYFEK